MGRPDTSVSAIRPLIGRQLSLRSALRAPYDQFSPERLLEYFSARADVHFFAVADESETHPEKIEAVMANRFEFNHELHVLNPPIDWTTNPSRDVEWHILLHKFYYSVGLGMAYASTAERRYVDHWVALTDSWIATTPPGFIAPDVTGRRVQNWIYAYFYFVAHSNPRHIPPRFHLRFLESIAEQVNFLRANLAAARNHRTLELYSIFLAGVVFPEFREAEAWRNFALPEIVRNMTTDLLNDGVQCELSTDYHHLVLKNYLCIRRLAAANAIEVPQDMDPLLQKALDFSLHAHNPMGFVPSLSDGDVQSFLDLLQQGSVLFDRDDMRYVATGGRKGSPPQVRSAAFPDSGYYIVRSGWGENEIAFRDEHHLIFDCGPLGAGNHGHFDCLSFELAAFGHRLIVDPGRYTYDESGETNWRVRFRSTAFHNTVAVDGKNQTRYEPRLIKEPSRHAFGSLRHKISGPAPEHCLIERISTNGFDFLHGSAKSYEYDALHERRIFFMAPRYWIVADSLTGESEHTYEARFHLGECAQDKTIVEETDFAHIVVSPHLLIMQAKDEGVSFLLEQGQVSSRYGSKTPAPVASFGTRARHATFFTLILPFLDSPERPVIREILVTDTDGKLRKETKAFSVFWGASTDFFFFGGIDNQSYRFGSYSFRGRFLAARKNALGDVTRAYSHTGATLQESGYSIRLGEAGKAS